MKKVLSIVMLLSTLLALTGCEKETIIEAGNQKYYVAELVGDPNNRNVLRATTVWSEDTSFEMLIQDYWEVKKDTEDLYNTDIYISSNEYEDDTCVVLPGTIGYGIDEALEKEIWQTTTTYGSAEDYYFYERISETEKRPVLRIVTFTDEEGNNYILEARYPETNYEACNADFSDMVATFQTLDMKLEDTYVAEEIFQPKWVSLVLQPYGTTTEEDELVIDYSPDWTLINNEEDMLSQYILTDSKTDCKTYAGVAQRDLTGLTYTEDVLVLDNNDMAKKYLVTDENGVVTMEIVSVTHGGKTYNFELRNIDQEQIVVCTDEFESTVKSVRTYVEEIAARTSSNVSTDSGTGTAE
ncbi:MAG: hypothetical protein WCT46_06035 [Candidatus Gracilibacteria bacterium]